MKRVIRDNIAADLWIVFLLLFGGLLCVGCGSTQSSATKEEQFHYGDRNPKDIHPPPAGFGPGASHGGGPPAAATKPPANAQKGNS